MIDLSSRKWHLSDAEASRYITARRYSPEQGEYEEDWELIGNFQFKVRYQKNSSRTDSGRIWGQTFGDHLGGYVGVSMDPNDGSYHVGTPAHAKSEKLVIAMEKAMTEKIFFGHMFEEKERFLFSVNFLAENKERREK